MKLSFGARALFVILLLCGAKAQAAITCTISSPGFYISYTVNTTVNRQTYFEVTCTRGAASDPVQASFEVLADNGLYPTGQNNQARATVGGVNSHIRYDVYTSATCATQWKGNTKISGVVSFSGTGDFSPRSAQTFYWGCITTAQTGMPSATYQDSVAVTMTYTRAAGATATAIGSAAVSIYAPAACSMATVAGPVAFSYIAFGAAQTASTNFSATCSNNMPYTLALSPSLGTLVGLNYSLALGSANSVGTGFAQTHTITGTMPAGQAGSCAAATCSGTNAHSVMITY